jgi:phospholipid/cholesterol/gamma-HCH transport system ATP-binding protein
VVKVAEKSGISSNRTMAQHLDPPASLVDVANLDFRYPERALYHDLSLRISRGKVTVIMGPSGCGKSTLLGLMAGRLRPQAGKVCFEGVALSNLSRKELYRLRRRMGMMFQNSALLSDLDVFENVAFPIRANTRLAEPLVRNLVLLKLHMVGLRGAARLLPAALSGGMARRVALARALALDPDLVMYDEPFTGLDPISKGIIAELIRELNDVLGVTSVVVTQDVREGLSIADHVIVFTGGQIVEEGSAQEVAASTRPQVRQFLDAKPDGPVPFHYPAPDYQDDLLGKGQ